MPAEAGDGVCSELRFRIDLEKTELDVHIFSDQSSLEIFADQYRNNHANNIFAEASQNQLKIRAHGGKVVLKDIEAYGLEASC